MHVSLTCVQTGSCNAGCASGVSSLHCWNRVFNPSLEKVHGRFVVGFKTETEDLFILSTFTSSTFSFFLLFSTPSSFGGAFGPKDPWKCVSGFVFSDLASFSAQKFCSSLVVGTKVYSGEEAVWKKFGSPFVN